MKKSTPSRRQSIKRKPKAMPVYVNEKLVLTLEEFMALFDIVQCVNNMKPHVRNGIMKHLRKER